jgi:long-subunit fatty acid transport protein
LPRGADVRWVSTGAAAGLALFGTTLVASAEARAGGFEFPDLGTLPIGRGTAFVARADSLDAWHYNPAGLAKGSGPQVMISGNVVHMDSTFRRHGSGDMVVPPDNDGRAVDDPLVDPNTGAPWPTVRNGKRFGPAPMIVVSWGDVGIKGLAISAGVSPPSGFGGQSWPAHGAQRYVIHKGDFLFLSGGVGLAYRPNRYFAIGANLLLGFFSADFDVATRQGAVGDKHNEEWSSDNIAHVQVRDRLVPSGQIGVMSQPLEWLELGLSVRLPMHTKARGSLRYAPGPDNGDAKLASKSRVDLDQTFPTVIRAGVRWVHRVFDVEADFVWENYRSQTKIDVAFSNPNADFAPGSGPVYGDPHLLYLDSFGNGSAYSPLVATDVPLAFRDTYSVRLGSDVEIWPEHLTVRAGGYWASSAYPSDYRTYSLRFPYAEMIGVGGGLTWHALPQLDVTAGYMHVFSPEVRVSHGIVQANAYRDPSTIVKVGNIVNNGTYRARIDLFGLALQARFWAARKRKT